MLSSSAVGFISFIVILGVSLVGFVLTRFKRCPADHVLVVYGKVGEAKGESRSARCHHGGAAFIVPIFQSSEFLDLTPIPIEINLQGALSKQNIRVNTPSTFTVGISTAPGVMGNAAERLLGLGKSQIQELARDIIFGQMRVVLATMDIEEINADREKLIENIYQGVEVEINKVGLHLINVNIHDITDESGYIDALGKEAAARAVNDAKVKVAEQLRDGEIGKAEAEREQRVQVAAAHATAVGGENTALVEIARSNAARREREAEAERLASAAEKVKQAQALEESYSAEEAAEIERAKREAATREANVMVPAEIEKRRIETMADAEAEKVRRIKKGEADGVRAVMEAKAEGLKAILTRKAAGFDQIVKAAGASPELAALLLATEQLPKLVEEQVKAIAGLTIDNITVWDSGKNGPDGQTTTAGFLSGLMGSLPPIHDLAKNVGVKLPEFLGQNVKEDGPEPPGLPPSLDPEPTPERDESAKAETPPVEEENHSRTRTREASQEKAMTEGDSDAESASPPSQEPAPKPAREALPEARPAAVGAEGILNISKGRAPGKEPENKAAPTIRRPAEVCR